MHFIGAEQTNLVLRVNPYISARVNPSLGMETLNRLGCTNS